MEKPPMRILFTKTILNDICHKRAQLSHQYPHSLHPPLIDPVFSRSSHSQSYWTLNPSYHTQIPNHFFESRYWKIKMTHSLSAILLPSQWCWSCTVIKEFHTVSSQVVADWIYHQNNHYQMHVISYTELLAMSSNFNKNSYYWDQQYKDTETAIIAADLNMFCVMDI